MTTETGSTPLAKFGPVGAPLLGALLLVAFVAIAYTGGDLAGGRDELTGKIRGVNAKLTEQRASSQNTQKLPSLDAVAASMTAKNRPTPTGSRNDGALHTIPTGFKVIVEDLQPDAFDLIDEDGNGHWDENEFRRSEYATRKDPDGKPAKEASFQEWDRNPKDTRVTRNEWLNPPTGNSDKEQFDKLDNNPKDDLLTPPEISSKELEDWDRDYDLKVDRSEYAKRFEQRTEVDLGQPTDVKVTADEKTMKITVTWSEPQLAKKPSDLGYRIERFCPETKRKRVAKWIVEFGDYQKAEDAWKRAFEEWWNAPSSEGNEIPRKDDNRWKDRTKAEQEYGSTNPRPVRPAEPQDWEFVADIPGDKTEYVDANFDLDVTYFYSVRAYTDLDLKRNVKADKVEDKRKLSAATEQTGRPLRIRNLIQMEYGAGDGQNANPTLSSWHWLGEGDSAGWYRVKLKTTISGQAPELGGLYGAAQLKELNATAQKAGSDTAVAAETLVSGDAKLDFRTGFSFSAQMNAPQGTLLKHSAMGECELPRGRAPAEQPSATSATMVEVRALGVTLRGEEAWFEINRWHQVGNTWYRIELIRKVKKGSEAGAMVDLASPGEGVTVYSAGAKVEGPALKALGGGTVDLTAGKFDGTEGRMVKLGSEKFDLFGAIYR